MRSVKDGNRKSLEVAGRKLDGRDRTGLKVEWLAAGEGKGGVFGERCLLNEDSASDDRYDGAAVLLVTVDT